MSWISTFRHPHPQNKTISCNQREGDSAKLVARDCSKWRLTSLVDAAKWFWCAGDVDEKAGCLNKRDMNIGMLCAEQNNSNAKTESVIFLKEHNTRSISEQKINFTFCVLSEMRFMLQSGRSKHEWKQSNVCVGNEKLRKNERGLCTIS